MFLFLVVTETVLVCHKILFIKKITCKYFRNTLYLYTGQRFAQLEIKLVTTRLLQNFKLELADPNFEPILSAELILKPVNGIILKLKPRN